MTAGGRGAVTADGCPVEVYLRLPHRGEADIVHAVDPAGSILDLGCGTGRITHPLLALGHEVIAVDASAAMLTHVSGAETVHAAIAGLELGRTVDLVLLASHLLNVADDAERKSLLDTAVRHLCADGALVAEVYPRVWFDTIENRASGRLGEVAVEVSGVERRGDHLTATVTYRVGDEWWHQPFTARQLDEPRLRDDLSRAGLSFTRWLDDEGSWFVARRD